MFTLIGLVTGYIIGKFLERLEWNKLIRQGVLPKPYK